MRGHDVITERLAQVPMFSQCTKRELQQVARAATEIEVEPGRHLTVEGDAGHEFMVVLEGTAAVTAGGRRVATLNPGDFFGEIALLDNGPRTATVTAETPMMLAVVAQREFSALLDDVPGLARNVLAALARRLREHEPAHA
jgi:CRP-like cAMP-binding protein